MNKTIMLSAVFIAVLGFTSFAVAAQIKTDAQRTLNAANLKIACTGYKNNLDAQNIDLKVVNMGGVRRIAAIEPQINSNNIDKHTIDMICNMLDSAMK